MDVLKINQLPRVYRPRMGKLEGIERSPNSLSSYELTTAKAAFNKFDVERAKSLDYEEIKPLLLHLAIMMEDKTLNEYINFITKSNSPSGKRDSTSNSQHSSTTSDISLDTFIKLFTCILSNQSGYFREIYNGKVNKDIDYEALIEGAKLDAKRIFGNIYFPSTYFAEFISKY